MVKAKLLENDSIEMCDRCKRFEADFLVIDGEYEGEKLCELCLAEKYPSIHEYKIL